MKARSQSSLTLTRRFKASSRKGRALESNKRPARIKETSKSKSSCQDGILRCQSAKGVRNFAASFAWAGAADRQEPRTGRTVVVFGEPRSSNSGNADRRTGQSHCQADGTLGERV